MTKLINGPEAFTPDNEFCLGESEVAGFFVCAGFCAHGLAGRGRDRQSRRRVDRRRRAEPRPLAHGHPPLRRRLPLALLHPQADPRDLRDLLRHPLPQPRAQRRPAAPRLRRQRSGTASTAPPSARNRAGSGSTGTSRTPPTATRSCGRAAGRGSNWSPAIGAEHRACRERGRDLRRVLLRQARDRGTGRRRLPRRPLRQPRRPRGRPDHLHADAEPARRDRVRLHRLAARRGALRDRHRHRLRQPRPRVDAAPPARRTASVRIADVTSRVVLLRGLGTAGARRAPAADPGRPRATRPSPT